MMREAWGRLTCLAIGMSIMLAPAVSARDFKATIIPARTPATPGDGERPLVLNEVAGAYFPPSPVQIILPMRVSTLPDPGRRAQDSYFNILAVRSTADPYAGIVRRVSVRGIGMLDLYTGRNRGFRLSAGPRYFMQYDPPEFGPGARSSSIALMRLPVGAFNLRDGYERLAPVAMAGYDTFIADGLKVGIEGGMMFGRAAGIYAASNAPGNIPEAHNAANPVADVTVTYIF